MASSIWKSVKGTATNPTVRRIVLESGIAVLEVIRRNLGDAR